MATQSASKLVLSGSTDGAPIAIGASATTIHTASATSGVLDEVWVFISNNAGAARTVTLTLDGTAYGTVTIWHNQADITFPRGILVGNGLVLEMVCGSSGTYATGFVNRYTAD